MDEAKNWKVKDYSDAGYNPIALTHELADLAAVLVVRIRDDWVFYIDPTRRRPAPAADPAGTATGSS